MGKIGEDAMDKTKMKRITLTRSGQITAHAREESVLKAGRFSVGDHVMLSITGDCCYHSRLFSEFEVVDVKPCDKFGGGRETVTFQRVQKNGELRMENGKCGGAK